MPIQAKKFVLPHQKLLGNAGTKGQLANHECGIACCSRSAAREYLEAYTGACTFNFPRANLLYAPNRCESNLAVLLASVMSEDLIIPALAACGKKLLSERFGCHGRCCAWAMKCRLWKAGSACFQRNCKWQTAALETLEVSPASHLDSTVSTGIQIFFWVSPSIQ